MTLIAFPCDRCKKAVSGIHTPSGTGGFYVVSEGFWAKYAREGEHFVCDDCIQSMPEFEAVYGAQPANRWEPVVLPEVDAGELPPLEPTSVIARNSGNPPVTELLGPPFKDRAAATHERAVTALPSGLAGTSAPDPSQGAVASQPPGIKYVLPWTPMGSQVRGR